MSFELQMLLVSVAILFVLLAVQGTLVPLTQGFAWGLGPRDAPRDRSVLQGRAARTVANQIEAMGLFVPLVVVVELAGASNSLTAAGAALFVAARAAFALFYLAGVPVLRSLSWGTAVVGLAMMAVPLSGSFV